MTKITKAAIDKLPAGQCIWDDTLPGFGVRAQASGSKSYIIRYRTKDGLQRKQKIGRTCDLTPPEARTLARKVFADVAAGIDPMAEHRARKEAPLMRELMTRYMAEHARPFKKPNSIACDEKNWTLHILPRLGDRRVNEITKEDVTSLRASLSTKRAAANQVVALLSKAMNLAEDWGWRTKQTNPCHRIKRFQLKKHDLSLTLEQIGNLHITMDKMVAEGRLSHQFASFIRLLQLTGCRKSEILDAQMSWVDLDAGVLRLPDSKVGARRIPLSEPAKAIIATLTGPRLIQIDHTHDVSVYRIWNRIKKEAGLPEETRLHDLRHTAGSLSHQAGMSQKEVADFLGHSVLATTAKYIHGQQGSAARAANALSGVIVEQWKQAEQRAS